MKPSPITLEHVWESLPYEALNALLHDDAYFQQWLNSGEGDPIVSFVKVFVTNRSLDNADNQRKLLVVLFCYICDWCDAHETFNLGECISDFLSHAEQDPDFRTITFEQAAQVNTLNTIFQQS